MESCWTWVKLVCCELHDVFWRYVDVQTLTDLILFSWRVYAQTRFRIAYFCSSLSRVILVFTSFLFRFWAMNNLLYLYSRNSRRHCGTPTNASVVTAAHLLLLSAIRSSATVIDLSIR